MHHHPKLYLLLAGVFSPPLAQAAPTSTPPPKINILLQQNKATSASAITVLTEDFTGLLGQTCASLGLSAGDDVLSKLVVFNVDKDGQGTITIGNDDFEVADVGGDDADGVHCVRMVDETDSLVSCAVSQSLVSPLTGVGSKPAVLSQLGRCPGVGGSVEFAGLLGIPALVAGSDELRVRTIRRAAEGEGGDSLVKLDDLIKARNVPSEDGLGLDKRQTSSPCTMWTGVTVPADNPDPHQFPMNVQLTVPFDCGMGECNPAHMQSQSFTIGFSVSANPNQWVSAGFAVEMSTETGQQYQCGGKEGERVCLWKSVGRTAYKVRNGQYNACTGVEPYGPEFEMVSPNSGDKGSRFYCVHGHYCRDIGDRYELERWPGGPGTKNPAEP